MTSKFTWRKTALILFVLNVLTVLWLHGVFSTKRVTEPERLDEQVQPQALLLNNAASQPASHEISKEETKP
jgi:hypothetical protein